MRSKKIPFLLFTYFFFLFTFYLVSAPDLRIELQRMVILENGRLKPLDTFARSLLGQFSGRSTFDGKPAIDWLTLVLFIPEKTYGERILRIKNPELRIALGLPDPERQRFSFSELSERSDILLGLTRTASALDERSRSPLDNDLMRLYQQLTLYYWLSVSLRPLVSLESPGMKNEQAQAPSGLARGHSRFSYMDLAENGRQDMARILQRMGEDFRNSVLAVIPPTGKGSEKWLSPWDVVSPPFQDREALGLLDFLSRAAEAFYRGDEAAATGQVRAFNEAVRRRAPGSINENKIGFELLYNRGNPFFLSQIMYAATFVLLMFFLLMHRKFIHRASLLLLTAGLLLHGGGILLRMLITGRPPVTNLYETFVFVAWIAACLGTLIEWLQKKNLGLIAGSCAGFILLLISGGYTLEGDTMGMLVAVLNTNLWLSVHVTTVTMGYAGCVVAGIIGHVYIIQSIGPKSRPGALDHTYRSLYATLVFGLAFTFLGTVMGGIWADQSWGRFWGWDPKENGALLIILWTAVLLHGLRAGMIGPFGLAAGSVGSIISVILAWFGVNLLGVGMHSYGFISGLNRALIAFVALEILFLTAAGILRNKKMKLQAEKSFPITRNRAGRDSCHSPKER